MSKIKKIFGWGFGIIKRLGWAKCILLVVVGMSLFMFIALEVTATPTFCGSCHIMNDFHDNWETSTHSEVTCLKCHTKPGVGNYMWAKIQGFSQSIDCLVGRVGTKPSGVVADVSCLRSHCHNAEDLAMKELDFNGVKFSHEEHISKTVNGIVVACGTCHNHWEGNEHFSVDKNACFTCHFVKDGEGGERVAEVGCKSCHEVPDKVIKRGMVEVNHAEFVEYEASCDDSCHKRQTEVASAVGEDSCLMCHTFVKSEEHLATEELHKIHSTSEKVECFECHGKVGHGRSEGRGISAMMDCRNCHSGTHAVQGSFYGAEKHPQGGDDERVIGPMYLTHVECADCHTGTGASESDLGAGTVAKAVPEGCDRCHKKGTGEKLIPFWQGQTKKLHALAGAKLDKLRKRAESESDATKLAEMNKRIVEVQSILDTVETDGSWGVHNLKYTEALLLKANGIINEAN